MDFIPKNPMLEFNVDTLQSVRKLYNLDQPGRMTEAINILEDWVKKQEHFVIKDFSREFLERCIIKNKGLLEKAKLKLDKICTMRTLMPHFFGSFNEREYLEELYIANDVILPKLTPENYRVCITRNTCKVLSNTFFLNHFRRMIWYWEYMLRHDYNNGCIFILDYSNADFMEIIAKLNVVELREFINLFLEGYRARIIGLHIITTSKTVDVLVSILKQIFSTKTGKRIYTHANIAALSNIVPKDMLPADYGGKERPILELYNQWLNILFTDDHVAYMNTMNAARTDESRRPENKFNEQYLGTPGTFRRMVVD